jgi:hypothetical protein
VGWSQTAPNSKLLPDITVLQLNKIIIICFLASETGGRFGDQVLNSGGEEMGMIVQSRIPNARLPKSRTTDRSNRE